MPRVTLLHHFQCYQPESYLASRFLPYNFSSTLLFKVVLDLSFKPITIGSGLILRPDLMVVPPIFTTDILAGASKKI